MKTLTTPSFRDLAILSIAALAIASLWYVGGYTRFIIGLVAIWTILCVGLNVLFGLAGLISLGQVGFFAIGAYACGILLKSGLSLWAALPLATLVTAGVGCILAVPAARMAGPFLAMVTIAFAFIVEHLAIEWRDLTGGQNGLMGFDLPTVLGYTFGERDLIVLAIALAGLALLAYRRFAVSGWGMAMVSLKDSDVAAASLGYSAFQTKLTAFAIAAGAAGLAGGLFTPLMMFIAPSNFMLSQSILFLFAVILGGAGTLFGPLIGAAVVVFLPELLSGFAEYRLLFFGALLIAVLLLAPRGIAGSVAAFLPERKVPFDDARLPDAASFVVQDASRRGLEVNGLGITFGGIKAVENATFDARPGQITAIIGPNGAGKTTLLNMISGFYTPDSGSIRSDGVEIAGWRMHEVARHGVARTYQATRLFSTLSVEENILTALTGGRYGAPFRSVATGLNRALARSLLHFVGYTGDPDIRAGDLPHVDKRLVEIARSLATQPHALLLDEPAAGLMRADKMQLSELLTRLAEAGIAVVLVEHDMEMVMGISDRVFALDAGVPIATGTPDEIRSNDRVIAAYLGEGEPEFPTRELERARGAAPVLSTKGLCAGYGAADVLHSIDLTIGEGELVALLGANGAGKSTFLSTIAGLIRPTAGQIVLNDSAIHQLPAHQIVERGLVLVPEGRQVFPDLTVAHNIELGGYRRRDRATDAELEQILVRFPRLRERLGSPAGLLSGGEQQMMAIARGLMANPKILLLDEPSLGLAPAMVEELFSILVELRDDGVTILLVDQMATLALAVADRAYVIEQGSIVAQGKAADLKGDEALIAAYLGGSERHEQKEAAL